MMKITKETYRERTRNFSKKVKKGRKHGGQVPIRVDYKKTRWLGFFQDKNPSVEDHELLGGHCYSDEPGR